jgi:hypothetical protein
MTVAVEFDAFAQIPVNDIDFIPDSQATDGKINAH